MEFAVGGVIERDPRWQWEMRYERDQVVYPDGRVQCVTTLYYRNPTTGQWET